MSPKRQKCPTCGAGVLQIAYGMPGEEMHEAAQRGEIILGGCVIMPYAPTWQCPKCGRSGGSLDGPEDELPLDIALRHAAGTQAHEGAPRTWSEIGLPRAVVAGRGLFNVQELLSSDRPWFVRGYLAGSGWELIQDEPEDRFGIGTAMLREDDADAHFLSIGDTVLYLGEVEGHDEPVLWPPALVVRMSSGGRRRTVWTLDDKRHRACAGDQYVPLRSLEAGDRALVEDLVMSGRATTRAEMLQLYQLFLLPST